VLRGAPVRRALVLQPGLLLVGAGAWAFGVSQIQRQAIGSYGVLASANAWFFLGLAALARTQAVVRLRAQCFGRLALALSLRDGGLCGLLVLQRTLGRRDQPLADEPAPRTFAQVLLKQPSDLRRT